MGSRGAFPVFDTSLVVQTSKIEIIMRVNTHLFTQERCNLLLSQPTPRLPSREVSEGEHLGEKRPASSTPAGRSSPTFIAGLTSGLLLGRCAGHPRFKLKNGRPLLVRFPDCLKVNRSISARRRLLSGRGFSHLRMNGPSLQKRRSTRVDTGAHGRSVRWASRGSSSEHASPCLSQQASPL